MAFIWHLTVIQYSNHTHAQGVLLNSSQEKGKNISTGIGNARFVAKTYFRKPYAEKTIHIKLGDQLMETMTGPQGSFSITFDKATSKVIKIFTADKVEIKGSQSYPVYYSKNNYKRLVVSDIDDTIMRSFTRSKLRRLFITLFKTYKNRAMVTATYRLYSNLQNQNTSFNYVSKSEANLFPLISKFIEYHKLPKGPLFLTPFLAYGNLLKDKKDPSFKYLSICHILDHADKKPTILIGDDTQADLLVYSRIIEKYGEQIEKIYIKKTRKQMTAEQQLVWDQLIQKGVESIYFGDDYLLSTQTNES